MNISKAHWNTNGNTVRLTVPFQKVDQEKRLVTGFATADNSDTQNDIVSADASANAFKRFRGNIREMHQPIAAGRLVEFHEEEVFDADTNTFYKGIVATAYISKGAPDTWEKVLDGTLSGFSIGGKVTNTEKAIRGDKQVNIIKDYDLVELSLVDNPANQLANIFSITKVNGADVLEGEMSHIEIENVFYCKNDKIAKSSNQPETTCPVCTDAMENIGWAEDKESFVTIVTDFEKVITTGRSNEHTNEGGANMADEKELDHGTHEEEGVVVNNATNEDLAEAVEEVTGEVKEHNADEVESASDVEEVEEPDFEKKLDAFADKFEKAVTDLKDHATESLKALEGKIDDLMTKHGELTTKFSSIKSDLATIEKRVDGVEGDTAIKKSNELGGSEEDSTLTKSQESFWGGSLDPHKVSRFSLASLDND